MIGATRGTRAAGCLALLVALAAVSCNRATPALPPLGEVLVVADTDLSVPRLVNRLRIDVYSADGSSWYSSRDVDRSHATDWPASFAVVLPDGHDDAVALVRLRAYASGFTRDYRGERYLARPLGSTSINRLDPTTPFQTSTCPRCPRLLVGPNQDDTTPPSEPLPGVTVDRLVAVRLSPGQRGAARVVLRGACLGTMTDLQGVRTCVDTDGVLVDEREEPLDPDLGVATPSQLTGSFEAQFTQPCTATPRGPGTAPDGTPLHDEQVCVPGGVFVLGSLDNFGTGVTDDVPMRLAAVPPFLMDKYEVTVGRWRAAVSSGLTSPDPTPTENTQPIPTSSTSEASSTVCTWSSAPRPAGEHREEYALTCVSWAAARAFCQRAGGDLSTEVQWEYAATGAGGRTKTRYPWGGADGVLPTCSRVVYERGSTVGVDDLCNADGGSFGPLPVTATDADGGDRTPPMGGPAAFLVGLGGGAAEWTLDTLAPFDSGCWLGAPVVSPSCSSPAGTAHVYRGGYWAAVTVQVAAAARGTTRGGPGAGLRCAAPGVR